MKHQWLWAIIKNNYIWILALWLAAYGVWKCLKSYQSYKKRPAIQYKKLNLVNRITAGYHTFLILSFLLYLVLLCFVTLVGREPMSELHYELSFLWEYRLAFQIKDSWLCIQSYEWVWEIINNILLFVPMGILYVELFGIKKECKVMQQAHPYSYYVRLPHWLKVLGRGFIISSCIELIQLVFRLGLFEFDDILNNCIGMLVGYGVCKVATREIQRICSS